MPDFGALLENLDKNRRASVISHFSATNDEVNHDIEPVLFPAAFGVAAGQHFDDGKFLPFPFPGAIE